MINSSLSHLCHPFLPHLPPVILAASTCPKVLISLGVGSGKSNRRLQYPNSAKSASKITLCMAGPTDVRASRLIRNVLATTYSLFPA